MATHTPLPRKRGPMPGGKKARDTYDLCHRAWRAGVLNDWYYGKRSPTDATIVWELNGDEVHRATEKNAAPVAELVNMILAEKGIESIEWSDEWIGYRSVLVTYRNGQQVTERLDESGQRVTLDPPAEPVRGMVWRQVGQDTDSLGRTIGKSRCVSGRPWELVNAS